MVRLCAFNKLVKAPAWPYSNMRGGQFDSRQAGYRVFPVQKVGVSLIVKARGRKVLNCSPHERDVLHLFV